MPPQPPRSTRTDTLIPCTTLVRSSGGDQQPWRCAPRRTLPGKAAHIALLARAQKSIELYPRSTAAPQITPLLSQPIVELCLSIPTWQWVRGGRDRAVARAAVADLLPALIAQRRTKGGPTGFLRRVFNARADDAIRMLVDGRLIAAGVLDPEWLRRVRSESWRDDGRDRSEEHTSAIQSLLRN